MEIQTELASFIIKLVEGYPVAAAIFMAMGVLRAIFKPIMGVAQAYVDQTESTSDNEKLEAFKQSKIYKAVSWVIDLFASVKLPKSK